MRYVEGWIKRFMNPWVMLGYSLLVGLVYTYLDQPLASYFHKLNLHERLPILEWVTQFGRSSLYLLVLPCIAVYVRYIKRSKRLEWRIWFVWFALVITCGLAFGLKIVLGRARPELLFDQHLFGFYGYHLSALYHSFPSGHATLTTALMLCLTLLLPRYRLLWLVLFVLIIATRVLLTYHYLSDVLVTCYLVVIECRILLYGIERECPLYWAKLGIK